MMKVLLVVATLSLCGCVSTPILPEYCPRLATAQNSDGVITLSWMSETGYAYRIYVLNDEDRSWVPLKGVDRFMGTGKTINLIDKRNPRDPLPWYSLRAEKL